MMVSAALMRAVGERRPENVVDLADGIVEGKNWPLVPNAEYLALYAGHDCVEMREFRGAPKVFIRFKLYDAGEHSALILFRAYRVKRRIDGKRFVLAPRCALLKMICRVTELQTRPDRISLRELKRHILRIRTRTVTKDRPPAMYYSVVDDVLGTAE